MQTTLFAVDRQEGSIIVLTDDAGNIVNVNRKDLPPIDIHEGAILRVPADGEGGYSWKGSVADVHEEKVRLEKAKAQLREMGKADRGGDISL